MRSATGKIVKVFLFILPILFIGTVFGYDNIITHPQITEAAIKIYQNQSGKILTGEQANWIIDGSIDEDTLPRYLNHYFDPTTGKGLDDYDETLGQNFTGISAKEWAKNQSSWVGLSGDYSEGAILKNYKEGNLKRAYQGIGHILHLAQDMSVPAHTRNDSHAGGDPYENWAKQNGKVDLNKANFVAINSLDQVFDELALFSHNNFFSKDTIPKDISNFKKITLFNGKKDIGYLVQSVEGVEIKLAYSEQPDVISPIYSVEENYQVHADYWSILYPKAIGYSAGAIEYFIKQFEQIDIEKQQAQEVNLLSSIWNYTKTTISNVDDNSKYLVGDVVIDTTNTIYDAYVSIKETVNFTKSIFSQPQQIDPLSLVANIGQVAQNNNQEIAAPRTSDVGARNDSEEGARNDNYGRRTSIIPPEGGLPGGDDIVVEIAAPSARNDSEEGARNDNKEDVRNPSVPARADDTEKAKEMTQEEIDVLVLEVKKKYGLLEAQPIVIAQNQPIAPLATAFAIATGVPDTNAGQNNSEIAAPSARNDSEAVEPHGDENQNQENQNQLTENNIQKPETPVITTNSGQDLIIQKFALQYPLRSISFILEGTKAIDISKIRINDAMDTVDSESINWRKEVVLLEGENIFAVATEDDAGNISDSATIKILLQFDNSTFYLTDYDVRKMNFTLNWRDDNNVIKDWELEYKLAPNFEWLRVDIVSADTSTNFTAKYDDLTYYFRLAGKDINGNLGDWITLEAEISTKPIVINEIAWRGTGASAYDEWIELANKTSQEIDLNGWILKTTDGIINVKLTDKIAANGSYLLERTADTTISNITADQIYKGALTNKLYQNEPGQNLKLLDKDNIEIDNVWTFYAGDNNSERTSERINIWSPSAYKNNWLPYSGSGNQEAQDADGNPVFGTPRAKNSQANNYFALNSGVFEGIPTMNQNAIFLKNRGPYMANGSVEVNGIKIQIEPGASFDFSGFGMFRIVNGGELIAKGTENEKIIMKSSTTDLPVLYFSGAKGDIENLEFDGGRDGGWITADNSNIKITNSIIKNAHGLLTLQNNSVFDISGSEFSGDNGYNFAGNPYYGEAILIKQGRGKIQNNVIKDNKAHGIYVESLSGALDILGNNFSGNSVSIATNGFIDLSLKDNIIGGNNMLMIYNPTVEAGEEVTISSQMPYFLYPQTKSVALYQIINPEIEKDGILKIEPGAIIEFDDEGFLKVYGELEAMGTLEKPIVLRQSGIYASYEDMVSNIVGTLTPNELNESDHIRFYDGSEAEAVLENVIIRREFVDQYKNTYYQSYWLTNEP